MSERSFRSERLSRQPAILSRKRKLESDLEMSEFSSPETISITSSCDNTPTTTDTDLDETPSPDVSWSPSTFSQFRGLANMLNTTSLSCKRKSPLPEIDWAETKDMWHSLVLKDMLYPRDPNLLDKHLEIEPRMRAILLDWLTEVCEVYHLHRETFYLAQDYIDRFLLSKPNLPRNCLQLLGATALFIASKMEEIYPPPLKQFAFVTAGACSEEEILSQEIILAVTLNWSLTPVTINSWLNIFLQLAFHENDENFIYPEKFDKNLFIQMSRILDLCIMDKESLQFSYSVLSASAIAHFISKETAMHVSGFSWNELRSCYNWMKVFVDVVFEEGMEDPRYFSDVPSADWHNIQTHCSYLKLLDQVSNRRKLAMREASPSTAIRQLTPPLSSKKMNSMNA